MLLVVTATNAGMLTITRLASTGETAAARPHQVLSFELITPPVMLPWPARGCVYLGQQVGG
jgi:hypothetical protein